jgi:hypothetical protein
VSGEGTPPRLLDATLRVDQLPAAGRDLVIAADAEERAALAAFLAIESIDALEARLRATRFRGGLHVLGRLSASVVQASVVSLEPVRQVLDEPIDRVFLPDAGTRGPQHADAELFVDLEGEDLPEPLSGPELDLSEVVAETLALGLDPYPRAPGESLETLGIVEDAAPESPFSALKSLADRNGKS